MFSMTNVLLGVLLTVMWTLSACMIRSGCTTLRIPKPGLTGSMVLVLVAAAGAMATQFALGTMMGMSLLGMSVTPEKAEHLNAMFAIPIWMLVGATVYRCMLPTTFGKAMILLLAQSVLMAALLMGLSLLASATRQSSLMEMRQMLPM